MVESRGKVIRITREITHLPYPWQDVVVEWGVRLGDLQRFERRADRPSTQGVEILYNDRFSRLQVASYTAEVFDGRFV